MKISLFFLRARKQTGRLATEGVRNYVLLICGLKSKYENYLSLSSFGVVLFGGVFCLGGDFGDTSLGELIKGLRRFGTHLGGIKTQDNNFLLESWHLKRRIRIRGMAKSENRNPK